MVVPPDEGSRAEWAAGVSRPDRSGYPRSEREFVLDYLSRLVMY